MANLEHQNLLRNIVSILILSQIEEELAVFFLLMYSVYMYVPWLPRYEVVSFRVMVRNYPTNIAPAALQRASRGQPPHGGQLTLSHWVADRWPARWDSRGHQDGGLLWTYSFIPLHASVPPHFLFHQFWPPTTNLMPPFCLLQWHRFSFHPSVTV